jgi:hypothetical protein
MLFTDTASTASVIFRLFFLNKPPIQTFFSALPERKPVATSPNAAANPPTNAPSATASQA